MSKKNGNKKLVTGLSILLVVIVIAFIAYSVYYFNSNDTVDEAIIEDTIDIGGENTLINVTGKEAMTVEEAIEKKNEDAEGITDNDSDTNDTENGLGEDKEKEEDKPRGEKKDEEEEIINIKTSTKDIE